MSAAGTVRRWRVVATAGDGRRTTALETESRHDAEQAAALLAHFSGDQARVELVDQPELELQEQRT